MRSRVIYHCATSLGLLRQTFSIHFVSPWARGLSWTRAFDLGVRRQMIYHCAVVTGHFSISLGQCLVELKLLALGCREECSTTVLLLLVTLD
jgi:hypothetical protein